MSPPAAPGESRPNLVGDPAQPRQPSGGLAVPNRRPALRWLAGIERLLAAPQEPEPGHTRARRGAAVLILLVDDDRTGDSPRVLLTRRADGLRYLPGVIAFPGGAVEADDGDVTATALREATEEIGLDPTSIEVLGRLPDRSTPDGRFIVSPVVAWSGAVRFNAPPNPGEVQAMALVRLGSPVAPGPDAPPRIVVISDPIGDTLQGKIAPLTAAWLGEIAAASAP
jgi:8-oxo-dGTP pyrophosphatase MutT (NUDIX family)